VNAAPIAAGKWPLIRIAGYRSTLLPLLLIVSCMLFAAVQAKFLRFENLLNILRNASYLSIISAGQMLVIVTGGFDISVGSIVALTSVSTALCIVHLAGWLPDALVMATLLGCCAGMLPAIAIGLVNGFCAGALKIPPFIVTIGTMSIGLGCAQYMSGGTPIYGLPEIFSSTIGRGRVMGIPIAVLIALIFLAIIGFVLSQTKAGRYFYAVGGNERGARFSGVDSSFYIGLAYVLSSLFAALTGVLLTARVGSGEAALGGSLMLESIAAAVIAGVSLKGGAGRLSMVAVSALFLSVIANGMNLSRIDSRYQVIVLGVIVIATVAFDNLARARGAR
jgi:ribose transport system permease protein